jgi:hypothetical protein
MKAVGRKGLPPQFTVEQSAELTAETIAAMRRIFACGYETLLRQAGRGNLQAETVHSLAAARIALEEMFFGWRNDHEYERRWSMTDPDWDSVTCSLLPVGVKFTDDGKKDSNGQFSRTKYSAQGGTLVLLRGYELKEGEDE